MPVTVKPIMPFYDDDSGAPPPFPCMLTDQLELFGNTPPSTSLLADEVLSTALTGAGTLPSKNPTSVKPVSRRRSPEPVLARARIASPYSRKTPKPHRAASNASENGSTDATDATSDTDSTSSSLSELSELSEDSKIPKPQGEPGRPGRGGYTLETALGWNQKAYSKFKVRSITISLSCRSVEEPRTMCMASLMSTSTLQSVRQHRTRRFSNWLRKRYVKYESIEILPNQGFHRPKISSLTSRITATAGRSTT